MRILLSTVEATALTRMYVRIDPSMQIIEAIGLADIITRLVEGLDNQCSDELPTIMDIYHEVLCSLSQYSPLWYDKTLIYDYLSDLESIIFPRLEGIHVLKPLRYTEFDRFLLLTERN